MKSEMKPIITAALCLAVLAGCSSGENLPDVNAGKCSPDFTATIGGVQTRAFDRQWEAGDEIGISGGSYTNVCHLTKEGDGRFTVKTPGSEIYFQDEGEVTFTAIIRGTVSKQPRQSAPTHGRRHIRKASTSSGHRLQARKRLPRWLLLSRTE